MPGECVQESDVNLSATSATGAIRYGFANQPRRVRGSLCGHRRVGRLIGTATDHDVIEAIRRAKEARSAA
jgi:osmoprotectant transport system ATP-binding protein